MSDKPINVRYARIQLVLAWSALDSLKMRFADPATETDELGIYVQPVAESLADVEAALKTLQTYVAQQDPDGGLVLAGKTHTTRA